MKKIILHIIPFVISFLVFESLEFLLASYFGLDFSKFGWGKIGLVLFFGFKYHIFCCLFPAALLFWRVKNKKNCQCTEHSD